MAGKYVVIDTGTNKRHQLEGAGVSPTFDTREDAQELCDYLNARGLGINDCRVDTVVL
jgi:hypothetical protein